MYGLTPIRPEITYAMKRLSRCTRNPRPMRMIAIQRVLKYLKGQRLIDYVIVENLWYSNDTRIQVRSLIKKICLLLVVWYSCIGTSGKDIICCGFFAIICCGFEPMH